MRFNRIKITGAPATYHCMSRTVNGERILDDSAKEVLRKQLWAAAEFCGVEVLTYCLLSNHFHVLVRVPAPEVGEVTDAELVRRYRVLYPEPTKHQVANITVLESVLREGGEEAEALRGRLLARMHDVSEFMKTVKQRFSVWYNRSHDRYGTLWAERYKSVLVEGTREAMLTVAAYIDLNPVRAALVEDPKDYRFCGYAQAVGGDALARRGLCQVAEVDQVEVAMASYRTTLFGKGSAVAPKKGLEAGRIDREEALAVIGAGGKLSRAELLRCRVRYFTDGAVLGSQIFVQGVIDQHRDRMGKKQRSGPRRMLGGEWGELTVLRRLRKEVFS